MIISTGEAQAQTGEARACEESFAGTKSEGRHVGRSDASVPSEAMTSPMQNVAWIPDIFFRSQSLIFYADKVNGEHGLRIFASSSRCHVFVINRY